MSRAKVVAQLAFYAQIRGLARIAPPTVLYALLLPYSVLRGIRPALADKSLPASSLPVPVDGPRPGFLARWRFQSKIHERWLPLLWMDRWDRPPWSGRMVVETGPDVGAISRERPIIVVTLHTGAHIAIGAWLGQMGLGVGSVIADIRLWKQTQAWRVRMRTDKRWRGFENSEAFLRGDTRSMVRYLVPGNCLLLQADHHRGRVIEGDWGNGRLQMSSGAFRIARLAGAAVIPVVVMDDGRWRFRVHVGSPVPQHLIDTGDDGAAATHVARELMPIVAKHPTEAMVTLVRSTLPPAEISERPPLEAAAQTSV